MEEDLKALKSVLPSLVVCRPGQFQGSGTNTVLTPIVPQVSSKIKQGTRASVQEPTNLNEENNTEKNKPLVSALQAQEVYHNFIKKGLPTDRSTQELQTQEAARGAIKKSLPTDRSTQELQSQEASRGAIKKGLPTGRSTQELQSQEASRGAIKKGLPTGRSTQELDKISKNRRSVSSSSRGMAQYLRRMKAELLQVVKDHPEGVRCVDLLKLYRERYHREINFSCFGYTSIAAFASAVRGLVVMRNADEELMVYAEGFVPPALPHPPRVDPCAVHQSSSSSSSVEQTVDSDDALPFIDYDPDVFPEDCISLSESIPPLSLEGISDGDMLELEVGEVYSPSHFWFYRLGEQYHIAIENIMDEMMEYYDKGEGASRRLAMGAVKVGHYCSSKYKSDWQRSIIVKRVDCDTVKVRHVDCGTVELVAVSSLKPLLRRWCSLPAQALRARLAGVRPAARGGTWPRGASSVFRRLVDDIRLVGNVSHLDTQENIVEMYLVNTSTKDDIWMHQYLMRHGHADPRPGLIPSSLAESYLYPRFDALESGATPNYIEICNYHHNDVSLELVPDYVRHVFPPDAPSAGVAGGAGPSGQGNECRGDGVVGATGGVRLGL